MTSSTPCVEGSTCMSSQRRLPRHRAPVPPTLLSWSHNLPPSPAPQVLDRLLEAEDGRKHETFAKLAMANLHAYSAPSNRCAPVRLAAGMASPAHAVPNGWLIRCRAQTFLPAIHRHLRGRCAPPCPFLHLPNSLPPQQDRQGQAARRGALQPRHGAVPPSAGEGRG